MIFTRKGVRHGAPKAFAVKAAPPRGELLFRRRSSLSIKRERFPSPVLCDVAEKPVFDLVPLARAWRKVTDMDSESCLVGEILEFAFPSTRGSNAQMWKRP